MPQQGVFADLLVRFVTNRPEVKQDIEGMRDDLIGFKKRLQSNTAIEFSTNVAKIKFEVDKVNQLLREAKKKNDKASVIELTAKSERLKQQLTQAKRELRNYTRVGQKDLSVLWKNFEGVNNQITHQAGLVGRLKSGRSSLWPIIKNALGIYAIVNFVKHMFSLSSVVEQARIAFTKLYGSIDIANDLLLKLDIFASKTPFDKLELIENAKRLAAYNFEARQVLPIMNSIGNAISAVGGNNADLSWVIRALGQMKTKGKLVQQEVNQIAERGIPIFDILREKLELTNEQLWDIGNQNIKSAEAIPLILQGIMEKYDGVMMEQSKTLQGRLSNVLDVIKSKMADLWEALTPLANLILTAFQAILSPLFGVLTLIAKVFNAVLVKGLTKGFEYIGKGLKYLFKNWKAVFKALLATFLVTLTIMKRKTIIDFTTWVVKTFLRGIKAMILGMRQFGTGVVFVIRNFRSLVAGAILATKTFVLHQIQLVRTRIATIKQAIANNIASFSFKKLGLSILGAMKKLLILGAKFFLIAGIVVGIVTAIYKNRDKLKEKLEPIFKFIAKIGQAAPQFIAKAWNTLVNIVAWAVKGILNTTKKLIEAYNKVAKHVGLEIDASGFDGMIAKVDSVQERMQLTAEDVEGAFQRMKEAGKGVFDAVKAEVLGNEMWYLDDSVLSVTDNFDSLGDSVEELGELGEEAGNKTRKALDSIEDEAELKKEVNDQVKDLNKSLEKQEDAYDNIKDKIKELRDKYQDFAKEAKDSLREVNNELEDLTQSHINARNEFENNLQADLSWRFIDLKEELADLNNEKLDVQKEINQLKAESGMSTNSAEQYRSLIEKWTFAWDQKLWGYEVKDLENMLELLDKQKELAEKITQTQAEQALIQQKIPEWVLDQAIAYDQLSETEKLLAQADKDRTTMLQEQNTELGKLKEKQTVLSQVADTNFVNDFAFQLEEVDGKLQAYYQNQQGQIVKLTDFENIKLAQSLEEKRRAIAEETAVQVDALANVKQETQDNLSDLKNIQANYYDYLEDKNKETIWQNVAEFEKLSKTLSSIDTSKLKEALSMKFEAPESVTPQAPSSTTVTQEIQYTSNSEVLTQDTELIKEQASQQLEAITAVDLANQEIREQESIRFQEQAQAELALHLAVQQQILDATLSSINQMKTHRTAYYSNLLSQTSRTVSAMISQYNRMITVLLRVIALQRRASRGWGYKVWGFTGWTNPNRVAGVVHEGEYVVPKWMVDKYAGQVMNLESIRLRGYKTWWPVQTNYNNQRELSIGNITVQDGFDFDVQMSKYKHLL